MCKKCTRLESENKVLKQIIQETCRMDTISVRPALTT